MAEQNTLAISMRPQSLEEIVGQSSVVSAIRKVFESGRQPVAWLFSGPTGTGKTTLAYIVARMIQGPDFQGEPEVKIINGADENGVEDMRSLISQSLSYPLSGQRKVFLLNEVQKLTDSAQDCLLEPLEKENSTTVWILTTTDPAKIKPALQGRCAKYFLTGLSAENRKLLVERALAYLKLDPDPTPLYASLEKYGLILPRDILNAVEKVAAEMSAEEACAAPEDLRPDFLAIAKAAAAGNWHKLRGLLVAVKPSDSLALRGMVASYFKSILLDCESGPRAAAYAVAITLAFRYTEGFSCGVTHPGTVAWLYAVCDHIATKKGEKGLPV